MVVPVPVRLTATVGFVDALLFTVSVPVAEPEVVGANFTFSVTVCFGLSVIGSVAPDTVKPVPLIASELMVSDAVPLDVIVTGNVALEFTATLPKFSDVVLIVQFGVPEPVPLRLTATVGFVDALLFTVSVPVAEPEVVGANFTFSVTVCFGLSVIGNVAPDTVKPVPLIAAELIVSDAVPLDVIVTGNVALEFTATLPKFSDVVLIVQFGVVAFTPEPVMLR